MLSLHDVYKIETMSVDEAMLSSRYKAQFRTRDGTVLPPTMTSRRYRQATMSVVDMSLAMDMDTAFELATPRHQRCYDDRVSDWRRVKRSRRRRHHDNGDDVELMDTVDHPARYVHHVTTDVITDDQLRPERVENSLDQLPVTRRPRLLTDNDYTTSQPKWTSSRYFQTHADRHRRRAAGKARHNISIRHHQRHQTPTPPRDVTRPPASSPVRHASQNFTSILLSV